jgi:hypothetical protein
MNIRSAGKYLLFLSLCISSFIQPVKACQCPVTQLGLEECDKYEIIFRGTVISVKDCDDKPGEAEFEVMELFKGNATKHFTVLFNCNDPCASKFNVGEEWIIYSRYRQISNAMMDWCSRSRKYFKQEKEDFYTVTHGNDYFAELEFLRGELGTHRLLVDKQEASGNRNMLPGKEQTIIILLISLAGIVLFYFLFRRFFK